MTMATWAAEQAASDIPSDIQPFLKQAFEHIGMAKVASSAYEAQAWGYLPPTAQIVMNSDRRLYVAKEEVLRLDHEGYVPPPKRNAIQVLGKPARALFETAAYQMQQGGYISDYDRFLANRLAYVLTGGDLSAPTLVSDDYLLGLERDMFLPLFSEKKTQERIHAYVENEKAFTELGDSTLALTRDEVHQMNNAYIVSSVRTAVGKAPKGALYGP